MSDEVEALSMEVELANIEVKRLRAERDALENDRDALGRELSATVAVVERLTAERGALAANLSFAEQALRDANGYLFRANQRTEQAQAEVERLLAHPLTRYWERDTS